MHAAQLPAVSPQRISAECDHLVSLCLHSWSEAAVAQGIEALARLLEHALLPLQAGAGHITAREARAACAAMHELCRPVWREHELIAAVERLRNRALAALTHLEPA